LVIQNGTLRREAHELAGLIDGPRNAWPDGLDLVRGLAPVDEHGVGALLFGSLWRSQRLSLAPPPLALWLRRQAMEAIARELVERHELRRVVEAWAEAGVEVLLIKGAALAYDVYPDPAWRTRCDVDALVRPSDRRRAREVLMGLGYRLVTEPLGSRVSCQVQFARIDERGLTHVYDLHWRLSNRARFATLLSFDDISEASIPLPRLSARARGLGRVHAVWLACVHQRAHHGDETRLIWAYDIHLLVTALGAAGLERVAALAGQTHTRSIVAATLRQAFEYFQTDVPGTIWKALEPTGEEPTARYLQGSLSPLATLCDDLAATEGWRARCALVLEHLFPSGAYMRRSYRPESKAPLFWKYGARIATGVEKWTTGHRRSSLP
jgi:hypothetical protein